MAEQRPAPSPQPITASQRTTLLLTTVVGHALKHSFGAAFFVLLPEIKAGLALTNTEVGTLSTFRNLAGGVANIPAGFIADRFARRRAEILGLSIAFIGVFALALGFTSSLWPAVAFASLMTASITLWHPSAIGSLSQQFASRRGFAIGLHGTGGSVGETAGPVLAGALIAALGWRLVLQGAIIPAVAAGGLIWILLRPIPTSQATAAGIGAYVRSVGRLLLGNRRLLLVLVLAGGYSAGQSSTLTFLPIYLREELGYSSVAVGLYLSLAQVAGIGAQPLMGYASDRMGRK
ncbi:MAG: MFS transporter, partial [SAR202 cluster bacterium]|nr:MFS transporter [SAR202 cluster bacterium]